MYYSALVRRDHLPSAQFMAFANEAMKDDRVDIKLIDVDSEQGWHLLEHANMDGGFSIPIIMAGDRVVGQGMDALLSLLHHAADNPHVHWEAGDGEDGDLI